MSEGEGITVARGNLRWPRLLWRMSREEVTGPWTPGRRRLALLAILAAVLTGAIATLMEGAGAYIPGALAYVMVTVLATFLPPAITVQVIGGQILIESLLLQGGPAPLMLVPLFAGVVITAELLAIVAWLDTPLRREPGNTFVTAGRSALIGAAVFGAVLLVSSLPGPGGLVAVGLASGACVVLASRLAREHGNV